MAAGELGAVGYVAARLEDEVAGDDTMPHEGGGFRTAAYRAVFQQCHSVKSGTRSGLDVLQASAMNYPRLPSDVSPFAALAFGVARGHFPEVLRKRGIVAVHGLQVGFRGRETVVHDDFPSAAFAHDGEFHAVAERRASGHGKETGVQDDAFRSDVVVRDVVVHVFDEAVVPHGGVVERGVADARVPRHATGEREGPPERPDTVRPGEIHVFYLL